jgi:hypothetical protein
MHQIKVYFGAFGDWPDASEVTGVVGREPSTFKPAGMPIGRDRVRSKRSVWKIESGVSESAAVEEQLLALFDILEPYKAGVKRACERYSAGIMCAAYWRTFTPGIHLSGDLIHRAAELGLSIDLDMYCLGADDAEPQDEESLNRQPDRATTMVAGKTVRRVVRHSANKVMLEFEDGTRLYVDGRSTVEISIT